MASDTDMPLMHFQIQTPGIFPVHFTLQEKESTETFHQEIELIVFQEGSFKVPMFSYNLKSEQFQF
jgi:hypothetical protein